MSNQRAENCRLLVSRKPILRYIAWCFALKDSSRRMYMNNSPYTVKQNLQYPSYNIAEQVGKTQIRRRRYYPHSMYETRPILWIL